MRSTPLIAMLLICLACTGGTAVDIDVALDPRLAGIIEVVSTRGGSPGATNPIDVEIVLANHGDVARRLELQGRWLDASGGFQGGASDVRILQPGQREIFTAGARSPRAKSFSLAVNVTTSTQDELLAATLADRTPKAPGHGITYDETPSVDAIPSWTPRGVANETAFAAKTILFRPNRDGWRLEISDRAFDPLRGTALPRDTYPDLQTVHVDLPREPTTGSVFQRAMQYGGGYFQIKTSPAARETTSWNTSVAWAIEISDWSRVPWVDGGATYQQGGTASGRLYVSFKDSADGIAD